MAERIIGRPTLGALARHAGIVPVPASEVAPDVVKAVTATERDGLPARRSRAGNDWE